MRPRPPPSPAALALLALLAPACAYTNNALREGGDTPYPESVEDERDRMRERQNWSAIAGPLEIAGGAAAMYLSFKVFGGPVDIFSPPQPPANSIIKDPLAAAFVGTLLAVVGTVFIAGGTGDLLAGTLGRALDSPFIYEDEKGVEQIVPRKQIDKSSSLVSPNVQLDATSQFSINERGAEVHVGIGAFHWPLNVIRLRYGLDLATGSPIFNASQSPYVGASLPFFFDWSVLDRYEYGRYPKGALTLFFAPGLYTSSSSFSPVPGYRTGAGLTYKGQSLLAGISHVPAFDSRPQVEVTLVSHFITN